MKLDLVRVGCSFPLFLVLLPFSANFSVVALQATCLLIHTLGEACISCPTNQQDSACLDHFMSHTCVQSCFSCVRLFETPWIVVCQAPLSMGFSRQEWVAMPSSRGSSRPKNRTLVSMSPALAGRFFTTSATWEAQNSVCSILNVQ